jgi:hypothetical protein
MPAFLFPAFNLFVLSRVLALADWANVMEGLEVKERFGK